MSTLERIALTPGKIAIKASLNHGAPYPCPYGYCPTCGDIGTERQYIPPHMAKELAEYAVDQCINGHVYPTAKALPDDPWDHPLAF